MIERETVCSERKMQRFPFRKGNKSVLELRSELHGTAFSQAKTKEEK
jgi:hypothetical protein